MQTINLFGRTVEVSEEQAEKLRELLGIKPLRLEEIPVGEVAIIGGREFVVLEHSAGDTVVILKGLYKQNVEFGETNCYEGSYADSACCDFLKEICESVGGENVREFELDLTSDDGLKDYGTIKRSAALLTTDMYRRYVEILDKHKLDSYWWLATPYSMARHGNDTWVKCVAPSGIIYDDYYNCDGCAVRPFCIFDSSIFVSM